MDVDASTQHKKYCSILVSIPVLFQKIAYDRESDRHSITLIKKYVKAILSEIFSEEEVQKIREQEKQLKINGKKYASAYRLRLL